jgi:hypothetical protein
VRTGSTVTTLVTDLLTDIPIITGHRRIDLKNSFDSSVKNVAAMIADELMNVLAERQLKKIILGAVSDCRQHSRSR